METTEILITVPALNEVFGWFVFWVWCGVVVYTVYSFSLVVRDYGRYCRERKNKELLLDMALVVLLWPFLFGYIRDNFSYKYFNRPYSYYH